MSNVLQSPAVKIYNVEITRWIKPLNGGMTPPPTEIRYTATATRKPTFAQIAKRIKADQQNYTYSIKITPAIVLAF